jgi:hypothetical protein
MTPLEAAIATGLPCFPCSRNKRPTIPGKGGYQHATADPAALRELWRRYPGPRVGMRTGEASGLSVLDIDKHPDAVRWLAEHRARLPATLVHRSGSGGLHFLFQHMRGVRNSQGRLAKGVDTRGEGGSVIWWPATGYPVLCDAPPAPWPRWLFEMLWPPASPVRAGPVGPLDQRRFEGLLRTVKFAQEKRRNTTLFLGCLPAGRGHGPRGNHYGGCCRGAAARCCRCRSVRARSADNDPERIVDYCQIMGVTQ